jgi:hypothetical protein
MGPTGLRRDGPNRAQKGWAQQGSEGMGPTGLRRNGPNRAQKGWAQQGSEGMGPTGLRRNGPNRAQKGWAQQGSEGMGPTGLRRNGPNRSGAASPFTAGCDLTLPAGSGNYMLINQQYLLCHVKLHGCVRLPHLWYAPHAVGSAAVWRAVAANIGGSSMSSWIRH